MAEKINWKNLDLVDGEGYKLEKLHVIEALREFRLTKSMPHVFFAQIGADHEDADNASTWGPKSPADVDWDGFPADLDGDEIETLGTMTNRDESGKHFTEIHAPEFLEKLEKGGWIEIVRPTHEATGIPYSQEYWHLRVTEKTEDLF
jgi:hypothetical protein